MVKFGTPNIERLLAKNDVKRLIKALKHKETGIRSKAAEALGNIGDKMAVEFLITSLQDLDVRTSSAKALGKIGDARAVEPLNQFLKGENSQIRSVAIDALGEIGNPTAIEPLIQLLNNADVSIRCSAFISLVKIGTEKVESHLIHAFEQDSYDLKKCVLANLKDVRNRIAAELLIQILKDDNINIRKPAVIMLGSLVDYDDQNVITDALIKALRDRHLREYAADSLAKIGTPKAADALINTVGKADSFNMAKSLGKTGDHRACETVINWLFMKPLHMGKLSPKLSKSKRFPSFDPLFGDYTDIIISALTYKQSETGPSWTHRSWTYEKNDWAVRELCKIKTPISSNILHKVIQKRDIEVKVSYDDCEFAEHTRHSTLNFESQREMAKMELEKRGNPPYDPSKYLNSKSWKL